MLAVFQYLGLIMTIAFWCVFVAGVLPYICAGIAKWGFQNFDNHNPRQWLAAQTGFRARANAAQQNSFEAFPFFAIAVFVGAIKGVSLGTADAIAVIFILARIGFIACYLMDKATLRTIFWTVGIFSIFSYFILAGIATFR
jgi:uncharacterized MAPEG superfamily protein